MHIRVTTVKNPQLMTKGIMQQIEEIHSLATTLGMQMKDSADTRIQMVDKIFQVERDLIDLQKAETRDGNFKN